LIDRLIIPEENKQDHISNHETGQVLGILGPAPDATNGTVVVMQTIDTSKFVEMVTCQSLDFKKQQQQGFVFYVHTIFSDPSQLWKLVNDKLKNKENRWQSDEEWKFEQNDDRSMFYIKNTNRDKVLEALDNDKVDFKVKVNDKAGQLWKKENIKEGYFILESSEFSQVLTANNENTLEIKGILHFISTYSQKCHIWLHL
jgi:hypothetical protein